MINNSNIILSFTQVAVSKEPNTKYSSQLVARVEIATIIQISVFHETQSSIAVTLQASKKDLVPFQIHIQMKKTVLIRIINFWFLRKTLQVMKVWVWLFRLLISIMLVLQPVITSDRTQTQLWGIENFTQIIRHQIIIIQLYKTPKKAKDVLNSTETSTTSLTKWCNLCLIHLKVIISWVSLQRQYSLVEIKTLKNYAIEMKRPRNSFYELIRDHRNVK